ncbi:MAG: hypothetical protein ABIO43_04110 [Sphingomicrobium sp.]
MFRTLTLTALLLVAACNGGPSAPDDSLDAIARDYVKLSLTIGEKEEGYIDAFYGPPELQTAAKAEAPKASLEALAAQVDALKKRTTAFTNDGADLDVRRAKFLEAQLTAAATRLRMMRGEKLSFEDEAQGLFGVRPQVQPLASFDPVIAKIAALVPGTGPLPNRIDAFSNRFNIPKDRLKPVFDAAIAECRRRTLQHIKLPSGERFDMAFVTGKSWSGYNYYQGNAHSKIEINTDLPIRISRAVDLGCHEGYPGHHVLNVLLEERLTKRKGWTEFSVYPLYSPQSLLAEGSANYGIKLAFPGDEQLEFEKRVLYPLAGLPVAEAANYFKLQEALEALAGVRFTVAKLLLEGKVNEAQAAQLLTKYQLLTPERAKKSIDFTKQYRSYVINYGLGQDMVQADIEAVGADAGVRWKRMELLLSEPTLPSDLRLGGVR